MEKDASLHQRRRLLRRLAVITAVMLGLYAIAGFVVVPAVARSELVAYMQRHDYRLTISKIRFNPFALSAQLDDVRLDDPGGALLGRFDRFYANFQISSLWHWAVTFADLELVNARFDLTRDRDGHFNWLALVSDLTPPQQQPTPSKQSTARLAISALKIKNLRANYTDHTDGRQFTTALGPIDLTVNDFTTYDKSGSSYHLTAEAPSHATLVWTGSVSVAPLSSSGSFDIKGLPLALLSDYFRKRAAGIDITGGALGVSGKYRYDHNLVIDDGRIVINDFGLNSSAGSRPLLKLPKLSVDGIQVDLDQRKVQVASVSSNGMDIEGTRLANGTMLWTNSLATLIAPDNAGSAAPAAARAQGAAAGGGATSKSGASSGGWRLSLSQLSLTGIHAGFTDERLAPAFSAAIDPLDIELRSFDWPAAAIGSLQVNGEVATGGSFSISGNGRVSPMDLKLAVGIQKLALAVAQPYVRQFAKATIKGGLTSADTQVRLQSGGDGRMQVRLTGSAGIDDLNVTGPDGKEKIAALARLDVKGVAADLASPSLAVDEVTLDKPFMRFVVDKDGSTNISQLLVKSSEGPDSARTPTAKAATTGGQTGSGGAPAITIGKVAINGGELDFADRTLIRPFHVVIGNVHGAIADIDPRADREAKIDLDGKVDHYSPVTIKGAFVPFGKLRGKVAVAFDNLSLTELNPFMATYAGYVIDRGKLDARFNYTVNGSRLDGKNHFLVREIKLGDRVESPRAVDIPLALGLALLKDSRGDIDLNLPVEGDITAPGFALGGIVGEAFVNAITKTAAAPFKILAGLVGGRADDLDRMRFDAGSAELSKKQLKQLDKLAEALSSRPQLNLAVRGTASPKADARALAETQLAERLDAMQSKPVANDKERWARVYKLYRKETGKSVDELARSLGSSGKASDETVHRAVWQALLQLQQVGSDALRTLANARAEAIVGALTKAGIAAQRIYLQDPDIQVSSQQGSVASRLSVST